MRNPIDRLTVGLPRQLRVTIDWLVTILGAILIVLAIKQWVINPYRIPSSSMEPTLNCAAPGEGCLAGGGLFDGSDRVPSRGEVKALLPLGGWDMVVWRRPELVLPRGMEHLHDVARLEQRV